MLTVVFANLILCMALVCLLFLVACVVYVRIVLREKGDSREFIVRLYQGISANQSVVLDVLWLTLVTLFSGSSWYMVIAGLHNVAAQLLLALIPTGMAVAAFLTPVERLIGITEPEAIRKYHVRLMRPRGYILIWSKETPFSRIYSALLTSVKYSLLVLPFTVLAAIAVGIVHK